MARTLKTPYTSVSDVDAFFERVETIGEPKPPKKVDSAWVVSYQFKTAHPHAIPSMLRWLGVIDDEGHSTGVWNELRVDASRETTLARLVKEAYRAVFDAVDVEKATIRDLRGAFVSAYAIGDPGRQIKCFLALTRLAGIATAEEATPRERESKPTRDAKANHRPSSARNSANKDKANATPRRERHQRGPDPSGVNITLNIEIPATWTEDQIRERIAAVTRAMEPAHPE